MRALHLVDCGQVVARQCWDHAFTRLCVQMFMWWWSRNWIRRSVCIWSFGLSFSLLWRARLQILRACVQCRSVQAHRGTIMYDVHCTVWLQIRVFAVLPCAWYYGGRETCCNTQNFLLRFVHMRSKLHNRPGKHRLNPAILERGRSRPLGLRKRHVAQRLNHACGHKKKDSYKLIQNRNGQICYTVRIPGFRPARI